MKKSIAVIGQGFVGGSIATVFAERKFKVFAYDIAGTLAEGAEWPTKQQGLPYQPKSQEEFVGACERSKDFTGVYFVCLPTPMKPDGSADVRIVASVLHALDKIPGRKDRVAVVKSTVPPGTTASWNEKLTNLNVIFSPEFLTEANALNDMRNQDRIILGGPRPHINRVRDVFRRAFPKVPIIKTGPTTAEMVKYVTNVHLAVKVALANEFYQVCQKLDQNGLNIDYDKVIEYAMFDQRLGKTHWQVPGPMPADDTGDPAFGFGGSCFVKDINALIYEARQLGIEPSVMCGAWEKNLEVRPQRDWEKLKGRAVSKLEEEV